MLGLTIPKGLRRFWLSEENLKAESRLRYLSIRNNCNG